MAMEEQKFFTIRWDEDSVLILDQRRLPEEVVYQRFNEPEDVILAIKDMVIRGAPAIGIAGAYGMALASLKLKEESRPQFDLKLREYGELFRNARPTAVNLSWAVDRILSLLKDRTKDVATLKVEILKEAENIFKEDIEQNKTIGELGAELLPQEGGILTHCNAGALATAGYGTALGVIRKAITQGKKLHIFVDETRPYLQGARLTAWELTMDRIPVTVIADNMAGFLMKQGKIKAVIIGADRIAANGDTANKIGSYSLSILAHYHNIPFYVAAPSSTFDLNIEHGNKIPIEERDKAELIFFNQKRVVPEGVEVYNPAFDVVPNELITAIITEKGVIYPPYTKNIRTIL